MKVPYSINQNARKTVVLVITLISLLLGTMISQIEFLQKILQEVNKFDSANILNTLLSVVIPPFLIFYIIYGIYCNWLWKGLIWLHKVPNLNGTWTGQSISIRKKEGTSDNIKSSRNVEVVIKQDWNRISIKTKLLDTGSTCSCTIVAIEIMDDIKIKYAYSNPDLSENNKYVGYNELLIEQNEVSGGYFTNKPSKGIFRIHKSR